MSANENKKHIQQNAFFLEQHDMNIIGLLKLLFDQKKIIFIITFFCILISVVYVLLAPPVYRAEVLLAPVSKGKIDRLGAIASQFGDLASLGGVSIGGTDSDVEEAIATLRSRELTNSFLENENIIVKLFPDKWDASRAQWKRDIKAPTLWDAFELFNEEVRTVNRNSSTGLITLGIEWSDPELASRWANELVYEVNNKLRQEAIQSSAKSIKYLKEELEKTSIIEVKESIYNLIEAQTKTKMLANTQIEYAFRVIDKAVVPEAKIKPKNKVIIIISLILGFIISIFVVLFKYLLDAQADIDN